MSTFRPLTFIILLLSLFTSNYVNSQCPPNQNTVVINMTDTWGDGWNGNTYTLTNSLGIII